LLSCPSSSSSYFFPSNESLPTKLTWLVPPRTINKRCSDRRAASSDRWWGHIRSGAAQTPRLLLTSSHYVVMVANNGLMRIFWPSDAPTGLAPGVLVGWRNGELDVFVVSILLDVEASRSSPRSECAADSSSFAKLSMHCRSDILFVRAPTRSMTSSNGVGIHISVS
jgi:hypothetical protein